MNESEFSVLDVIVEIGRCDILGIFGHEYGEYYIRRIVDGIPRLPGEYVRDSDVNDKWLKVGVWDQSMEKVIDTP